MSPEVTEPYSTSCSPTLRGAMKRSEATRWATLSNSAFSFAARSSCALRSLAIMALLASLTAMARPRGSRKLRP